MSDILSQEEIDALLHGVDENDVQPEPEVVPGSARHYDFASQDRIVRGRMPSLELVNERFARLFRASLFNLLRLSPEVSASSVQLTKYSEYVASLFMPASMNLVKMRPLRGTALFNLDPKLIFSVVDMFFGGSGKFHFKVEGRDFTGTEMQVVHRMLELAFTDMVEAWAPVLKVAFEHIGSEVNPHFANIASPSEVVVVNVFNVELEGGGGELHVALPYGMLEPIRELLDTGVQSDRDDMDDRWRNAIEEEIFSAEVELSCRLTEKRMVMSEVAALRPGDIIPVEIPPFQVVTANEIPIFRATFGVSRGNLALQVDEFIPHPATSTPLHLELASAQSAGVRDALPELSHDG